MCPIINGGTLSPGTGVGNGLRRGGRARLEWKLIGASQVASSQTSGQPNRVLGTLAKEQPKPEHTAH